MNTNLIKWRLQKAKTFFEEGVHLYENNFFYGSVNRFYYAIFQSIRAILATKELDSSKHSGVLSLFNLHFVKPGLLCKKTSKIATKVFSERTNADYDDFKVYQKTEVEQIKSEAETFINEIQDFLKDYL